MKILNPIGLVILFAGISFLYSCKKEKLSENNSNPPASGNRPPVANAGLDISIALPLNSVTLDGSQSSDPDNNLSKFSWRKISGPSSYNLSHPGSSKTILNNLVEGSYEFELTVIDVGSLQDRDTVAVLVAPAQNSTCWICISGLSNLAVTYSSFLSEENTDRGALYLKGKIFFAGGFWIGSYATPEVDMYDTLTKTWSNPGNLSIPRGFIATSYAGNKALFAGGSDYYNNTTYLSKVDLLDITTMQWAQASLSEARKSIATASVNGKAYFIGGKTTGGFSKKIDVYSAEGNSWSVMELVEPRGFAGATVINNKIYIGGGQNSSGNLRQVDIYDPASGQWSYITAPNDHPKASVIATGSKLFIAGGDEGNNRTVDIYDTQTDTWESALLSDARNSIAVAKVNNKIIFMGNSWSLKIDVYDITSNTWLTGKLNSGIVGATAASSGSLALFGGFQYSSNTWTNQVIILQ